MSVRGHQHDAGAQGQALLGAAGADEPVQFPALGVGQHDLVGAGRRTSESFM